MAEERQLLSRPWITNGTRATDTLGVTHYDYGNILRLRKRQLDPPRRDPSPPGVPSGGGRDLPSGWCKHRIAAGLAKRVAARVRTELDAPATGQAAPASASPAGQAAPASTSTPLPEAPASVNCYVTMAGRQCQLTLRDTDETRLLQRLAVVLAQYPITQACTPPPAPPTPVVDGPPPCAIHGTTLKASTKATGTWYCPVKGDDGQYCQTRWPAKASR